ncbi:hypothetical protein C8R43DRAFT_957506 [Mycena crocata]|nr:hypothetical protein C8R43DRAFT_957506 [Mycena crocata]
MPMFEPSTSEFEMGIRCQYLTLETSVYDKGERREEILNRPLLGDTGRLRNDRPRKQIHGTYILMGSDHSLFGPLTSSTRNRNMQGRELGRVPTTPAPHKQCTAATLVKSSECAEHLLWYRRNSDWPQKAATTYARTHTQTLHLFPPATPSIAVPRSSLPKPSPPQVQFTENHSHNMLSNTNNGNNIPFIGFYMDGKLYADHDLYPVFTTPPNTNPTPASNLPSVNANAMSTSANSSAVSNTVSNANAVASTSANPVASTSANIGAAANANGGAPAPANPNANGATPANVNANAAGNGFYMDGEVYRDHD